MVEIEEEIICRYTCCMEDEPENMEKKAANRNGGIQQAQMNKTVAK